MKCQFCKKEFKTQEGFEKHMCEKKSRYVNFNVLAFYVWKCWHKFTHIRLAKDEEKNKIRFVCSKEYLVFEKFSKFLEEIDPYDCADYLKYLVDNKINVNKWQSSEYFHKWVEYYAKKESRELGIIRSKKYLEQQGVDIKTISESRLFNYLYNGRISPWYIDYIDKTIFLRLGDDLIKKIEGIIKTVIK